MTTLPVDTTASPRSNSPSSGAPESVRRHDLDAVRSFAMSLGVVLHACLSLSFVPWPITDGGPFLFLAAWRCSRVLRVPCVRHIGHSRHARGSTQEREYR